MVLAPLTETQRQLFPSDWAHLTVLRRARAAEGGRPRRDHGGLAHGQGALEEPAPIEHHRAHSTVILTTPIPPTAPIPGETSPSGA
jgi:hypothetical protein